MVKSRKNKIILAIALAALLGFYFSLPKKLFQDPYSTVLLDKKGMLLGASIAQDGQWRFPTLTTVPEKFQAAVILFEDKRFMSHWGVDILAMGRAMRQNIAQQKVVSGGSTLSMQVIRLSRKNKSRTIFEKLIESILALRLELRYTKDEILALHASHAPFGGNVVGLEAACWRYFGRSPDALSWSEAAALAVLPNNPALIHPGKNRDKLLAKRNRLLARLAEHGYFDSIALALAKAEPLPEAPLPLPRLAPHLLALAQQNYTQQKLPTTLDKAIQQRSIEILNDHRSRLAGNQIFNAAILIADVKTGYVLAYVGNNNSGDEHQDAVDIIQAKRSTGSILKPVLYAAMLKEGKMLPTTLQPDIPTYINGFVPKNFSKSFDGAVHANEALIRSLNIPAVHELREYRFEKFHSLLTDVGITSLNKPPDHYGLTLILGGAEASLWDIVSVYASMGRTLLNYFERPGQNRYSAFDIHPLSFLHKQDSAHDLTNSGRLSAGAIYQTFDVLKNLYRPGEETGWQQFNSARRIAWKTGTSHGLRDAWAVGINPNYVIGVWVGNADGEGRPGLTGTEAAAPILFDVFSALPGENVWFQTPNTEMVELPVCRQSGHRATELCFPIDTAQVYSAGLQSPPCPYHRTIHLAPDKRHQVHSDCEAVSHMISESWFVLPPVQEFYYRNKVLTYRVLPPFRQDCANPADIASFDLVYPKPNASIFIPTQLDGTRGEVIFEAVHRNPADVIYWHLDGNYLGATATEHKISVLPGPGVHTLTLIDGRGEILKRNFSVIKK